ncbi:succinylglutamate desuccinylase/aspartoacylase family protein [Aliiglaciecola sp. CAU 1673]|uniref:succinylglutamate desuccinylase/aspartoacylase domain-containing protein n=1 Tax=Aliiglaciecola sp. CAU 1673 TaxID=3032595 RepID=UPI0023DBAA7D|nr:succinylglutamate desuccinylase/aspartoacylase family protein [Aliiglaciecola sp. CAU 1673]MDF2179420.1 succinylglutamate desuccinylase/aspartoacylase family protein [Aliiglaciecola sp. CAU 1673]
MAAHMVDGFQCLHANELEIGESPTDLLRRLGGPTVIDVPGLDGSRTRVVCTLIHGNEPSGFFALHRFLKEGRQGQTNLRFILPSVPAALEPPLFTHRYLPWEMDLNRCFPGDTRTALHQRAQAVMKAVEEVNPECTWDLHNTSGSGPAFSVSLYDSPVHLAMAGYFTDRMILTGLRMGALMEQELADPIITIECGGAMDSGSHETAFRGLCALAQAKDLQLGTIQKVELLRHPIRVELRQEQSLAYGYDRVSDVDVSICASIEHKNQGITPQGSFLGWINNGGLDNLIVRDEAGNELPQQMFTLDGDKLHTAKPLRFFMATTRADIAVNDCLFYVVEV